MSDEARDGHAAGHVFKLGGVQRRLDAPEPAGRIVTEIGKVAGVVVKRYPDGKPDKFASAHDLRRSFGERCAKVVMPAAPQRMMRHKSVLTTMRYYPSVAAHALAQSVWLRAKKVG